MKKQFTFILLLFGFIAFGQDQAPTTGSILSSPVFRNVPDSLVFFRALNQSTGAYEWYNLATAKHLQYKIDSLANKEYKYWTVKWDSSGVTTYTPVHRLDTLNQIIYYQKKDTTGDGGVTTRKRLVTELFKKRNLNDHDSLSTLQEKNYSSLDGKPDLTVFVQKESGKHLPDNNFTDADSTLLVQYNLAKDSLRNFVVRNALISAATKTKITYDTKGLVTSGADATTYDITQTGNRRFITPADSIQLDNLTTNLASKVNLADSIGGGSGKYATGKMFQTHITNTLNPHNVTYTQVGAAPSSSIYWQRIGTILSPVNAGDYISTVNDLPFLFSDTKQQNGFVYNWGASKSLILFENNITGLSLTNGAATFGSTVSATQYTSTITTGTSPLTVASTTMVSNLNADLLDGQHGSYYQQAGNYATTAQLGTKLDTTLATASMRSAWTAKQTALSGTGYLKFSGTTPSYVNETYMQTSHFANSLTAFAGSGSGTTVAYGNHDHSSLYQPLRSVLTLTTQAYKTADSTKLAGIAAGATNVTNTNQLTNGAGFITSDIYWTGTSTNLVAATGRTSLGVDATERTVRRDSAYWNTAYSWGNHASAGYLTYESDPTIYSWAKASTKPSYTYSEVGAAPSSTVSFPGFGTSHSTSSYGDHNHSGVYLPTSGAGDIYTHNASEFATTGSIPTQYFSYSSSNLSPTTSSWTITAGNFILSSDKRLKTPLIKLNKKDFYRISKIDFGKFFMKDNLGQQRYGVIAQDVEKVAPEFVRTDEEGMKSVAYIDLLIAKIAELENRIAELEKIKKKRNFWKAEKCTVKSPKL